jgi:uncharacterized membrane protein
VRSDPALRPPDGRFARDGVEFARLVNLSDAVFAIAMTLLVLGLDVPDVAGAELAGAVRDVAPQLLAFVLGFALVANVWWMHHRLFSRLDVAERGLIALDLALLGVVASVPFPTGLVGRYPTEPAAVVPFVGGFIVLNLLFVALIVRAHRTEAWTRRLPDEVYPWVLAGYLVTVAVMVVAVGVAFRSPVAALVVVALSGLPEVVLARRAPAGYRDWA